MSSKSDTVALDRVWRSPLFVLAAAALVVFISFGGRQSFGLFMRPITLDLGWGRETLSIALATQALMIGIAAPFAGALADRWGAPRTVALGGAIFALGILAMSQSRTPEAMFAGAGLMVGIGLGGCGLPLVLSVVGKVAPENSRSLWLGIATATATGGQLVIVPIAQALLSGHGWTSAMLMLALIAVLTVPLALSMSAGVTLLLGNSFRTMGGIRILPDIPGYNRTCAAEYRGFRAVPGRGGGGVSETAHSGQVGQPGADSANHSGQVGVAISGGRSNGRGRRPWRNRPRRRSGSARHTPHCPT